MNLKLVRSQFEVDGIFGVLYNENKNQVAVTLEHAYDSGLGNGSFAPKIPPGTYTCQRSQHRLHGMPDPFTTFQIMDVPGHDNILFHWGNFNSDSEGCILLGRRVLPNPDKAESLMITSSKNTFLKFMDLQKDVDSFQLTVE